MSGENPELKAGHPPAGIVFFIIYYKNCLLFSCVCIIIISSLIVKAGGMRVVTKHRHKEPDADAYDDKYKDSVNPMGPPIK